MLHFGIESSYSRHQHEQYYQEFVNVKIASRYDSEHATRNCQASDSLQN